MTTSKLTAGAGLHHKGDEPHLLREIVRTHQVLMTGFSRNVGMPASRLALMRLLARVDEDLGVMDLARHLGINAASVTRQVKEMEAEGLVGRRADSGDGRRSYVRLSSKGLEMFQAVHERGHNLERALSAVIGADDMAVAVRVLAQLREFIEDLARRETQ